MLRSFTVARVVAVLLALLACLIGIGLATRQDPAIRPYLVFAGGGFIFNYRVADVYYGFNLEVTKPLASGSIIEASFEDPGGKTPHRVELRVNPRTIRYSMRSPNLRGVEAGRPYRVTVTLYDWRRETVIERHEKFYTSQISDSVVPDRPLTVGPGYHRPEEHGG